MILVYSGQGSKMHRSMERWLTAVSPYEMTHPTAITLIYCISLFGNISYIHQWSLHLNKHAWRSGYKLEFNSKKLCWSFPLVFVPWMNAAVVEGKIQGLLCCGHRSQIWDHGGDHLQSCRHMSLWNLWPCPLQVTLRLAIIHLTRAYIFGNIAVCIASI